MSLVNANAKLAQAAGVGVALLVTVSVVWTTLAGLCSRGLDGKLVGFGLSCETPGCDAQSLFSIMPAHQTLIMAAIVLVVLGVPIGHLAYTTVGQWLRLLPPK